MVGGREVYCRKDENPSDDCDTTLCTMNEDGDDDDLMEDKEGEDIFAKVRQCLLAVDVFFCFVFLSFLLSLFLFSLISLFCFYFLFSSLLSFN